MDKPLSILIKETKENLVNVCNSSQLPPSVLELIFENIHAEINLLTIKQLEQEELEYYNALQQENNQKINEENVK